MSRGPRLYFPDVLVQGRLGEHLFPLSLSINRGASVEPMLHRSMYRKESEILLVNVTGRLSVAKTQQRALLQMYELPCFVSLSRSRTSRVDKRRQGSCRQHENTRLHRGGQLLHSYKPRYVLVSCRYVCSRTLWK